MYVADGDMVGSYDDQRIAVYYTANFLRSAKFINIVPYCSESSTRYCHTSTWFRYRQWKLSLSGHRRIVFMPKVGLRDIGTPFRTDTNDSWQVSFDAKGWAYRVDLECRCRNNTIARNRKWTRCWHWASLRHELQAAQLLVCSNTNHRF